MIFRLLMLLIVMVLIELYAFQAIKTVIKNRWVWGAYMMISLFVMFFLLYQFSKFDRRIGQTQMTMFTFGLLLLFFLPKLVISFLLLLEDVYRFFTAVFSYFCGHKSQAFLTNRRLFVSQLALGIAAVPFASLLYGMTVGKYNFKVRKQTVFFPNLPLDFENFTITQISDVHSGSLDDAEKINYAINLINEQNADMILFTGDIVNTHATEMDPWIAVFNKIQPHSYGKYAVLGNHDYGEYIDWKSKHEKDQNFSDIKSLYGKIGFQLMLNEHTYIHKGNDKIALVGVENWGVKFKKAGDLTKASQGLTTKEFKILMSHDPSHWDAEVQGHPKEFHLTLSGHTHGLQFGIEIPGFFKWSPASFVYKQWAGLYHKMGKYIYVNRGFGFHAYPGRVGIMPEITIIQLKKGNYVS